MVSRPARRPRRGLRLLLGAAVTAAALAPPPASAETGLLARWALDDGTAGSTTPETTGAPALAAALQAGATTSTGGRFGNALELPAPAIAGSRAVVAASPVLEPAQFTISAWVRSDLPGTFKWVLAKGAETCNGASYGFSTGGDGGLSLVVRDAATFAALPIAGPAALWDDRWHAVAATFDGAALRVYLDGAPAGTTAHPTPIAYGLSTTRDLVIGSYGGSPAPCVFDYTFPGRIDEVRLYDRALTDAQVAVLHSATATTPPEVPDPGPPPPTAPTVTEVRPALPIVPRKPIVLAAATSGEVTRLEWDVTGDGTPDVVGVAGQTGLVLRPPPGDVTVGVRAVGPGGTGPYSTLPVTVPPIGGSDPTLPRLLPAARNLGPVYTTGPWEQLISSSHPALKDACLITADTTVHFGGNEYTGCLRPIRALSDIPARERGILTQISLGRVVRFPVIAGGVTQWLYGPGLDLLDGFVAAGPVRMNGVTITPAPGAVIALYPAAAVVASSNAALSLDGIRLQSRSDMVLDTRVVGGRIPLGTFPVDLAGIRRLAGFELGTDVRVTVIPGSGSTPPSAEIVANLKLPPWLTVGGVRAQGRVTVRAFADGKLILDALRIGPIEVDIADAVSVEGLQLDYVRATDEWNGQGKVCVPGGACLDMIPPNGGVTVARDALKFAGATLVLPPPGIPLFPGLQLEQIGFGVGLDPTRIQGNARVVALQLYEIEGRLLLAFPSAAAPYVFDPGPGFPAGFYGRVHTRATIAIAANAFLRLPLVGRLPMANGYFVYEAPGYVAFGGGVDQDFLDVLELTGRVDGEFNAANGRFSLSGQVTACVIGLCRGAIGVISSRGVGGCIVLGPLQVGGGVIYDPFEIFLWPLDGCKWSTFKEPNVRAAGPRGHLPRAEGDHTVTIGADRASRAIRLEGAVEAPQVRVTGPDGATLDSPAATGLAEAGVIRIMRSTEHRLTVVGLQDPAPGTYTITPLPGAAPATDVREAGDLPDAKVTAGLGDGGGTVRGLRAGQEPQRTLRYDIARRPEQVVTFVELSGGAARTIGVVQGGGKGTLRFTSLPGKGQRTIEARFELHGLPAERRTVARYTPEAPRLATPRGVRATHRRATLRVAWKAVEGAARYEVTVTTAAGQQRRLTTTRRQLTVGGVPASDAGRVSVRAVATLRSSTAASVAFPRTAPRPSRVSKLPPGR